MRSKPSILSLFLAGLLLTSLSACGSTEPPGAGEGGSGGAVGTGGTGGPSHPGTGGSGGPCVPTTCEAEGAECGWIYDGCGEILGCGSCEDGSACGLREANRCESSCEPRACADLGVGERAACGLHDDGCGGELDCGACAAGTVCGDGVNNVCVSATDIEDPEVSCLTKEQACDQAGIECGPAGDGCGGLHECGGCTAPDRCGGGGVAGQCGGVPPCQPRTCAELGFECGMAVDGCGGLLDCNLVSCPDGEICGGGGANRCGTGGTGNEGGCEDHEVTTVSGVVRTPAGASGDPVYGALVYIPKSQAEIPPLQDDVSCQRCDDQVPPVAIAHAITGPDGAFTLVDVPPGDQTLVIQLGKWRRVVEVELTACEDNDLVGDVTRLPRRHHEDSVYDNIPKMAVATGRVDGLECVLRKIGVADDQFSDPDGGGRIHFYRGSDRPGATYSSNTPSEAELVDDLNTLLQYDAVLFGCQGREVQGGRSVADTQRLIDYADAGGRIFATHFSRDWLQYVQPFKGTANWTESTSGLNSSTGRVDQTFPKGQDFGAWMRNVGASNSTGSNTEFTIYEARRSVGSVNTAQRWIYTPNDSNHVQHMTFNTPVGDPPADQCGRVVFTDFHVTTGTHDGATFPDHCGGPLTAQEKVLAFMLFDLASCIQDDDPPPPTCTPRTCADAGRNCGLMGDGCGDTVDCGSCSGALTCGGGGTPGVCGEPTCTPQTCADVGYACGLAGDGCGGELDCGTCPEGQLCGVGGPGQCGAPTCTPQTCAEVGASCGMIGDGCGGVVDCGCCPGDCDDDPQ